MISVVVLNLDFEGVVPRCRMNRVLLMYIPQPRLHTARY